MRAGELKSLRVAVLGMSLAVGATAAGPARAFDPGAGVTKESGPFALFKFGFSAYKSGRKDEAVEAYRYAAEKGHTGSRWALANMYAYGDGVAENDLEAFKIYSEIAQQGVEPGSEDTGYFVNALISLAGYYRRGIPDTPVRSDCRRPGSCISRRPPLSAWRKRNFSSRACCFRARAEASMSSRPRNG